MSKWSRTRQAVESVRRGASIYSAAKEAGLAYSTVHAAVKRMQERKARGICPHCKQLMPKSPDAKLR